MRALMKFSLSRFSYCLLCVTLVICLCHSSLFAQKNGDRFCVVLDAGHGGHDAGAIGHGGREKDINLQVTMKVGALIKERYPAVKVLYTRTNDTFIGLQQRAAFANRNKADLFISIHTNSATSRSARGTETYVLGLWRTEDNLRVAMRENQSIMLEENYQEKYQGFDPKSSESYIIFELMQNRHLDQSISIANKVQTAFKSTALPNRGVRQAGFLVIRETAMPSILIELGFISNSQDAAYLLSNMGQQQLADAITKGFGSYYSTYCKNSETLKKHTPRDTSAEERNTTPTQEQEHDPEISEPKSTAEVTKEKEESVPSTDITYRIQIAASKRKISTKDAQWKGLSEVMCHPHEGKFIYTTEETASLSEARTLLQKHKKRFPDAFIVVFRQNRLVSAIYR